MDIKQFKRLDAAATIVAGAALAADIGWLIWALATGVDTWPPVWFWLLALMAGLMFIGATPCLIAWSQLRRARIARELRDYDGFQEFVKDLEPISTD